MVTRHGAQRVRLHCLPRLKWLGVRGPFWAWVSAEQQFCFSGQYSSDTILVCSDRRLTGPGSWQTSGGVLYLYDVYTWSDCSLFNSSRPAVVARYAAGL